jgi:pyridoxamine 5'-phosphate oxidase
LFQNDAAHNNVLIPEQALDTMHTAPHDPSLAGISKAHSDIIAHLFHLSGLGTHGPLSSEARQQAQDTMAFFRRTVLAHHQAEERRLFPLVLAKAEPGDERAYVETLVGKLTAEHRQIETLWASLESMLTAMLNGTSNTAIDTHIQGLVLDYGDHATEEETLFLPLCQEILRRSNPQFNEADLLHMPLPTSA